MQPENDIPAEAPTTVQPEDDTFEEKFSCIVDICKELGQWDVLLEFERRSALQPEEFLPEAAAMSGVEFISGVEVLSGVGTTPDGVRAQNTTQT